MGKAEELAKRFIVKPGQRVKLSKIDPDDTAGIENKDECETALQSNIDTLFKQQTLLSASDQYAVLVVLQAMDAGGKDGAIRHVMTGLNPQFCRVTSFKVPSDEEAHHDFLWRAHMAVPRRGYIGIFNRSHYEDVLVARVHQLVPEGIWSGRYDQINDFEKMLSHNNVVLVKFFLHISKEEQAQRLEERIEDQHKNWKLMPSDFKDHALWDSHMAAYEDALAKCSTKRAPWYVIPSNQKWFRDFAISQILVGVMDQLKMKYPTTKLDVSELRKALEAARRKSKK